MATHIIGERRREPRTTAAESPRFGQPHVPGVRVLEVIDVSRHGLRCRIARPVRPGRAMPLKLAGQGDRDTQQAWVVRCEVCRLSRLGVQYEAAWSLEQPWPR
jgi:hypothetical protein